MSRHHNWLLTVFLISGAAAAQGAAPAVNTAPAGKVTQNVSEITPHLTCPPDESFVDIQVAGISRGGVYIRTGGSDKRTWLERSAIHSGEEAYFDAELTCDEIHLVRLRPELTLHFDPEQLTLAFEPQPSLLGTSAFTVNAAATEVLPTLPLFNLAYDVAANTELSSFQSTQPRYNAQYNVRLEYLQSEFSALAGVHQALNGVQSTPLVPYARARYQFGQTASVQAASVQVVLNLQSNQNFWQGQFSGLQAQITGNQIRFWPSLSFVLPLAADVRVSVDGHELQHQQFAPGTVTLEHIPLGLNEGQIVVDIEDESGRRSVSQPYLFPPELFPQGGYAAQAEGGWLNGQLYAAGAAGYGLTQDVTLEGEAGLYGGSVRGVVWGVIAPPRQLVKLGVGVNTSVAVPSIPGIQATQTLSLKAQYRYAVPGFSAEVVADVPVASSGPVAPEARVVGALRYAAPSFNAALSGGYDPDLSGWYGRLDGDIPLQTAQLNISPFVAVTSRSTRVGVGVNWNPDAGLLVQASGQGSFGGVAGESSALALSGFNLSVSDQLTPQSRVSASTDLSSAALGYDYRGPLEASVAASSTGTLSAQVQGRVSLIADRLSLAADSGTQRFILLKTGIPDLGINAEGLPQGRTNAQGELLLAVQSASGSQIQVDASTLPIEISLQAESLTVNVPNEGVVVVDWTPNFIRSRFVTFQDAVLLAAGGGYVTWPGQDRIDLNDSGEGLLPALNEKVDGTLTFADGRQCPVTIAPDAKTVTCTR